MIKKTFTKFFGTKHDRTIKKLRPLIARVNALEESYRGASDDELKAMTGLLVCMQISRLEISRARKTIPIFHSRLKAVKHRSRLSS